MDSCFSPDTEGTELRDIQDARIEAVVYAAETLKGRPEIICSGHDLTIQVSARAERFASR